MTPQQIKKELRKGCGKRWTESKKGDYAESFICGWDKKLKTHWLCKECKAKLSILTEYDKSIKEMIENFKKCINNCGNLKCIEYEKDGELITHWVGSEPYINLINEMIDEELLTKIGDNSEVKE